MPEPLQGRSKVFFLCVTKFVLLLCFSYCRICIPFGLLVPVTCLWSPTAEYGPFPASCSHHTLTIHLGGRGLSSILPCHLIQLTTKWWSIDSLAPLFTRTYGYRSDNTIIIVVDGQRLLWIKCNLHRSPITEHHSRSDWIRQAFPNSHVPKYRASLPDLIRLRATPDWSRVQPLPRRLIPEPKPCTAVSLTISN